MMALKNKIKRLVIGAQNLPDWEETTVLDADPLTARYHNRGLSRKKHQFKSVRSGGNPVYQDVGIPYFHVPLNKCLSASLHLYGREHHHPFVHSIQSYLNGDRKKAETILLDFFKEFQPATLYDFFNEAAYGRLSDSSSELLKPIPEIIRNDTFEDTAFPWSWHPFPDRAELFEKKRNNRLYFGPESDKGVKAEAERLFKLTDKINHEGYHNDFATPVEGYILCDENGDYRFMIRRGKHRVAVLSALGYESITATFVSGLPRGYDVPLMYQWPKIKNKLWAEQDAITIIRLCFAGRGNPETKPAV